MILIPIAIGRDFRLYFDWNTTNSKDYFSNAGKLTVSRINSCNFAMSVVEFIKGFVEFC